MLRHDSNVVTNGQFTRRDFLRLSSFGAACAAVAAAGCTRFQDVPGPSDKHQFGRTVNALSAVVTGLVAQSVSPGKRIEAKIEKPMWPSADMHGRTTEDSIDVSVDLSLSSCRFTASGKPGSISGDVDKSEFDWTIKQTSMDEWKIGRAALKFDYTLSMTMQDGKIKGTLTRPGGFDWKITGSYGKSNFEYTVTPGLGDPSFSVKGKLADK